MNGVSGAMEYIIGCLTHGNTKQAAHGGHSVIFGLYDGGGVMDFSRSRPANAA